MSQGSNDTRRDSGFSELQYKLDGIRTALDKLDENILSIRRCIMFMNQEIDKNMNEVSRLMCGNMQRLNLVKDFNDKLGILVDKRDSYYKEYINMIPLDIIKDVNNEMNNVFSIDKLSLK